MPEIFPFHGLSLFKANTHIVLKYVIKGYLDVDNATTTDELRIPKLRLDILFAEMLLNQQDLGESEDCSG